MTARSLTLVLGLTLAGVWIASACLVHRPSDALACSQPSDCTAPRTCENGFCVVDPNGCPAQCASCDMTVTPHVCQVTDTGGMAFTCPTGLQCDFTCTNTGACHDITCSPGATCTITCTGDTACDNITCNGKGCTVLCTTANACHNVTCGGGDHGTCDIKCTADNACNNVTCPNACACDVTCTPNSACGGTISCPRANGNNYCTASQNDGDPCISTAPNCNRC